MIEQGLIKSHFVGKDGFQWWIGQITPEKEWGINLPSSKTETTKEMKGFDFRYKVRIMGYHTACNSSLPDVDLPWASVMLPVTAGVSGGGISTPNLRQGDFVYGFFLDGEDAQQPIIMGVIGHNQYTAILKEAPEDPEDCGFKPFSGFTVNEQVPTWKLTTTQEEPGAVAEGVDVDETNNNEVAESSASATTRSDGASLEQYTNESQSSTVAANTDCDVAPVGSIQREIKNMLAEIERIKKTESDWRTKVSTTVNNIEGDIDKIKQNTIKAISGDVKRITTELQKNALMKVNDALSDSYDKVFPTELPLLKEEADKANSELACAFKNIMKNLTGMVGNFLSQIMDRFINTPMCAVENFVGSLLGKISGLIDGAVNSVMGPIKALLAGMGVASSGLDDVMGFATDLLSFLVCNEDPKCSDVKEWNPVNGPEITATLDLNSIFSKAKEAASLVKGAVEDIGNIGDAISDVAKNANFDDIFVDHCNVGPVFCGPPTVEFIGGGGAGTKGNVIVSALTTVLGVDVIMPGGDYLEAPRVKFIDSCNKGRGAKGRAVLGPVPVQVPLPDGTIGPDPTGKTTIGVTQIIMDDTGIDYMPSYDGSQGGDGRTWADRDETTVKHPDGTYDIPYKPGITITVCPGDEVTHPGGQTEIITGTECRGVTTKLPPPEVERGRFPSTSTGDYPVVLEIEDINVVDGGFGYDPNDEVIIEPSNGAKFKIKTDPLGSVTKVDVINGGIGFNEDPHIYIKSKKGYNARLMPVFKVNRIGEEIAPEVVAPTGVIQVIDCVGKF